jgi:ATP-dependent DNA helicase RecG
LVFQVEVGEAGLHANTKDVAYLRVGDENRRLRFAERQELNYDRGEAGSYEARSAKIGLEAVDEESLSRYVRALHAPDSHRLLVARGFATDDGLTIAGALMFGDNPQLVLPEAYVRVVRYRGTERGSGGRQQLVADLKFEGPVPQQLARARAAVKRLQPKRRALRPDGRFGGVGLIPEDAWLEGIVNAVIHRSYSLAGDHIRVELFDDRLEITSPGSFPRIALVHDPPNVVRYARNPRIARACAELGYGQELGEGVRRIYDEMRLAGLSEPVYELLPETVRLELLAEPMDPALAERLPAEAREILFVLRIAQRMSTSDVASAIGMSRPATIKRLNLLKDAGLIKWVGNSARDPRAYWTLPRT